MIYVLSHGTKDDKQVVMITSDMSFITAEITGRLNDMGIKNYHEYQQKEEEEKVTVIDYGRPTCYFIKETKPALTKDQSNAVDYEEPSISKQDIFKAIAKDILTIDGINNIELNHRFIKVLLFTSEDGRGRDFPILISEGSDGIEVFYDYLEDEIKNFTLDFLTFEEIYHYMKKIQKIIEFHTGKI